MLARSASRLASSCFRAASVKRLQSTGANRIQSVSQKTQLKNVALALGIFGFVGGVYHYTLAKMKLVSPLALFAF